MATTINAVSNSPTLTMGDTHSFIPNFTDIDPSKVEFVYDADLDELTFRWTDRRQRAYHHDIGEHVSALVDPTTHATVGFVMERFSAVIAEDPSLAAVMRYSTRLVGDRIIKPELEPEKHPTFLDRLRASARAMFSRPQEDQEVQGMIRTLEHLVGVC